MQPLSQLAQHRPKIQLAQFFQLQAGGQSPRPFRRRSSRRQLDEDRIEKLSRCLSRKGKRDDPFRFDSSRHQRDVPIRQLIGLSGSG